MPFGKKALTPQAHTQGVGDEAHVAEMLEFLGRRGSRLMCPLMTRDALGRVVVEDGLFRLQRPGRGFQAERAVAEEDFKRLQWLQPRNSQVFRSCFALLLPPPTPMHAPARARTTANQPGLLCDPRTSSRLLARFRLHFHQPASDAVNGVLDLEGSEAVGWLLGTICSIPSRSPATDKLLGKKDILGLLRDNVPVDERGLATLLRALELIRESVQQPLPSSVASAIQRCQRAPFDRFPAARPQRGILHVGAHLCEEAELYWSWGFDPAGPNVLWIEANADIAAAAARRLRYRVSC
jgi:hypothetical protein